MRTRSSGSRHATCRSSRHPLRLQGDLVRHVDHCGRQRGDLTLITPRLTVGQGLRRTTPSSRHRGHGRKHRAGSPPWSGSAWIHWSGVLGLVILWQFRHPMPESRERTSQRLAAVSFFTLAAYLAVEAGTH